MPTPVPQPEPVSREELVERLRLALAELTDQETSICKAAAERGIFCRGFARYNDQQLRRKYDWIVRKRPGMTRADLEQVANDWQLAQQEPLISRSATSSQIRKCSLASALEQRRPSDSTRFSRPWSTP